MEPQRRTIKPDVIRIVEKARQEGGTLDLVKIIDAIPDAYGSTVQNIMSELIRNNTYPGLEVISRGNVWRFPSPKVNSNPDPEPFTKVAGIPKQAKGKSSPTTFTYVGETRDGEVVLQDAGSDLWKATRL